MHFNCTDPDYQLAHNLSWYISITISVFQGELFFECMIQLSNVLFPSPDSDAQNWWKMLFLFVCNLQAMFPSIFILSKLYNTKKSLVWMALQHCSGYNVPTLIKELPVPVLFCVHISGTLIHNGGLRSGAGRNVAQDFRKHIGRSLLPPVQTAKRDPTKVLQKTKINPKLAPGRSLRKTEMSIQIMIANGLLKTVKTRLIQRKKQDLLHLLTSTRFFFFLFQDARFHFGNFRF